MSAPSLFYAYMVAGLSNAAVCMFCYFMVYVSYDISVKNLAYTVPDFFSVPDGTGVFAANADGNPARNLVICGGVRRDDLAAMMSANDGAWARFAAEDATALAAGFAFAANATAAVAAHALNATWLNATAYSFLNATQYSAAMAAGLSSSAVLQALGAAVPSLYNATAAGGVAFPQLSQGFNDAWAANYSAWAVGPDGSAVAGGLLVDQGYLMGAVRDTLGCNVFTPHRQWLIYGESQAAWYLTLVMCQFWHIWSCRTRVASIFTHGLLSNVVRTSHPKLQAPHPSPLRTSFSAEQPTHL